MKRMMKKKIHPDIEGKMQRDVQMNPICGLSNPTNDQDAPNNELASLLLIQGIITHFLIYPCLNHIIYE